jgi:dipeptide/tripeptide permease
MTSTTPASPLPKPGFVAQMKSFPPAFWVANIIELIERFSFFGVRTIAALYIVESAERGGLAMSNVDRGIFFGTWSLLQCILPMFTGGFADRYGYRVSLMVAFSINIVGYATMGYTTSWWAFMGACCLIATGTAIFKPPLHGTLAHCVNESNSSVGWGMFYQVVNIGGFIGPMVCGYLRLLEWRYAFFAAAGIIVVNMLVTLLFLKDCAKTGGAATGQRKGPGQVFAESMKLFRDVRFIVFLAIFSGFWFMFMQLFDQLSIFIDQWVNTRDVASFLTDTLGLQFLADKFAQNNGQVNPEWIVNVDAGSIILLVLLVSYITGKFRPISAMIVGMFICCAGLIMAGTVTTGWLCVLGIFVFAVGEMACSPKFSEYVALMAPADKKALYMGYSNIPFAIGWAGANFIGGPLYERMSDKIELARRYLIQELGHGSEAVRALSKGSVMPALAEALGQTEDAARQILWNHYRPQSFWFICMAVGLLATLAMVGYHFWLEADTRRRAARDAAAPAS